MPKRDLVLLDAAEQVADQVNALIDQSPRGRLLHVSQMRASVQSIAANISEGLGRRPGRDRERSFEIARGETEETIQQTINFSKKLPLNVAIFHIAAPYPGTPFFYEVVENGWFRPGTDWEQVDMDKSTVLDYENLSAERLNYWQKRATREWTLRPGPILTILKGLNTWAGFKSAVSAGWQTLSFIRG